MNAKKICYLPLYYSFFDSSLNGASSKMKSQETIGIFLISTDRFFVLKYKILIFKVNVLELTWKIVYAYVFSGTIRFAAILDNSSKPCLFHITHIKKGVLLKEMEKLPSSEQLGNELAREKYRISFRKAIRSTLYALITVAAVAVLVAVLLLPVLRIYGTSMSPTVDEGNYVVSVKGSSFETGDVIAFYYNNKILVKRVIAKSGDWIDIDAEGNVYVNNELLEEPYLTEKAFGDCNISLPYQVPEERVFVMGDHRSVSVDSRNTAVGCVADEQIVGKIIFRIWPLSAIGTIK
jgi:signal peptidase I